MKHPLVSVIISTKNEAAHLPRLLKSLKNQSYRPIETFVVDNYSNDQTLTVAKLFKTKIITIGPERSSQRNIGAQHAKGDFYLFPDADMELNSMIIDECVRVGIEEEVSAVVIPETVIGTSFFCRIKRLEKKMYEGEPLIEAARFFSAKAFQKAGGYNEQLVAGEDWDLSQRVRSTATVGRIQSFLIHHETSLIRELKHKWYYATKMRSYKSSQPASYQQQSGLTRLHLFWQKRNLFSIDPFAFIGLIFLKSIEYMMYQFAKLLR